MNRVVNFRTKRLFYSMINYYSHFLNYTVSFQQCQHLLKNDNALVMRLVGFSSYVNCCGKTFQSVIHPNWINQA